ncbi:hypothetical protein EI555_020662 [Monodon monoceros]|uniref:PAS domain-containing protein n=1 Tax=Monodon monoceros TaxID=40151 RepID=A0A4U1FAJ6_MONMO|nr:hypothetical protein EI555_020662 [Monodon monoceros]
MGCAQSIHASESRVVYHGGNEAEDAPDPAAPLLQPGGPRLPPGQTTAASARSCGSSLVESEPSGGSGSSIGNTVAVADIQFGPMRFHPDQLQRYVENPSAMACYNELLQMEFGLVRPQLKLRACNSMFTALEKSQEAIEITSEDHIVQYANPAFETTMGYESGELIGKDLAEVPVNEKKADLLDTINSCIRIGKATKIAECVQSDTHTEVIYNLIVSTDHQSGKHNDRRKSSLDVRTAASRTSKVSSQRRRSSTARIHSMKIEAPITKVKQFVVHLH